MKNITKKQSEDFLKKATDMIIELGAEKVDSRYPYKLDTIAGDLKIKVDNENISCYTIFTKFEKPELAKEKIAGVNIYSGKWNFHIRKMPVDIVVEEIKSQFETILKN